MEKLVWVACLLVIFASCAFSEAPDGTVYSVVTYNGKNCRSGHNCGTYWNDFYWCWTYEPERVPFKSDTWDYCCRPDHPCGNHGTGDKTQNWCAISDKGTIKFCNLPEDKNHITTVTGGLCNQDRNVKYRQTYCSHHGHPFRWCYTDTFGNWRYCCSPHSKCECITTKCDIFHGKHTCDVGNSHQQCYTYANN